MAARTESEAALRKPRGARAVTMEVNGEPDVAGSRLIDLDLVRGLIEAVDQSGIDSLDIRRGSTRIRIAKSPPPAAVPATVLPLGGMQSTHAAPPAASAPAPASPPAGAVAAEAAVSETKAVEVKSPMVGTFYRAPAPEAPPYVEVGSTVAKGQTLCIIEAMKLMNELESEVDGVVVEVLANNADPIEYGQVLFRIAPAGSA
jgi:acetyl-CoA carboxylase biotin carboxyl carrier protein